MLYFLAYVAVGSLCGFGIVFVPSEGVAQDLGTAVSQIVTIDRQRLFSDTKFGRPRRAVS